MSLAGDWWCLDQKGCGDYHQEDWQCAYDVEPTLPTWTEQQLSLMKGGETCMWGEGINKDNIGAFVWRSTVAAAERLWSPRSLTPAHDSAAGRLAEHLCRLSLLGVKTGPISPSFCPSDSLSTSAVTSSAAAEALAALDSEGKRLSGTARALIESALRRSL